MYWMHCKEKSSHQCYTAAPRSPTNQSGIRFATGFELVDPVIEDFQQQKADQRVQQDVGQVEVQGVSPAGQPEAETKREHGEWSVGLVARPGGYISAPEVVGEDLDERGAPRFNVPVADHRLAVVKHKAPPAAVGVASQSQPGNQRPPN